MSLLETLILPGTALAFNRVTFVIKEELRYYPIVRHIMIALKVIAVSRQESLWRSESGYAREQEIHFKRRARYHIPTGHTEC
jgi:1-acyl-sn-glycerol-3-phosphate acyltransferase